MNASHIEWFMERYGNELNPSECFISNEGDTICKTTKTKNDSFEQIGRCISITGDFPTLVLVEGSNTPLPSDDGEESFGILLTASFGTVILAFITLFIL